VSVLGPRLLPEFREPVAGRLDLFSAALSVGGVLAVIYGLKRIAIDGVGWPPALFIVVGLAVGAAFVQRQRTLSDPLIDLRLFRIPAFRASLCTNLLSFFAAFGAFLFIAQYLQLVLGLSPLRAGVWTVPSSLGFVVGAMLAPAAIRRMRPAFVIAGGLALAAAGLGMLTQVDAVSGLAVLVTGSVVMALGLSPVITVTTDLIVGTAPPERAGAASAISETSSEFGGALGIAILGSIGAAVYRSRIHDGFPAGVPSRTAEAARDTLGGAVAGAERLPDKMGSAVLDAAHEAFTNGMRVVAVISVMVLAVLAVVATLLLRDRTVVVPETEAA
jgi:DHA2 family multidrug resistance protein-like MFS transporter